MGSESYLRGGGSTGDGYRGGPYSSPQIVPFPILSIDRLRATIDTAQTHAGTELNPLHLRHQALPCPREHAPCGDHAFLTSLAIGIEHLFAHLVVALVNQSNVLSDVPCSYFGLPETAFPLTIRPLPARPAEHARGSAARAPSSQR